MDDDDDDDDDAGPFTRNFHCGMIIDACVTERKERSLFVSSSPVFFFFVCEPNKKKIFKLDGRGGEHGVFKWK